MKKLLALLLCLAMLGALTACGDVAPEDVRGEQNMVTTLTDAEEDTNPTNAEEDTTTEPTKELELGSTKGLNYENKFIGIGCNLDNNWVFYTDEEIRKLNNWAADMAGDEFKDAVADATVIYDMYAATADSYYTININLEKQTPAAVALLDINASYKAIQSVLKDSYSNMGYTGITFDITTAKLDGMTLPVMKTNATIGGFSFTMMSVMLKCDAGYVATISIGSLATDKTDELLGKFYWTA